MNTEIENRIQDLVRQDACRRRRGHETLINSILSTAPVRSHGLIYLRSHVRPMDVPFGVAADVRRQTAAQPVHPTIQESSCPTLYLPTQPITQVGRGRSQSEPSPVLFVHRRALIHSLVQRPPCSALLPFKKIEGCESLFKVGKGSKNASWIEG
jgi:hypothetical protein